MLLGLVLDEHPLFVALFIMLTLVHCDTLWPKHTLFGVAAVGATLCRPSHRPDGALLLAHVTRHLAHLGLVQRLNIRKLNHVISQRHQFRTLHLNFLFQDCIDFHNSHLFVLKLLILLH
jgi:hypothetical protein